MNVLVDTSVWSLALRRDAPSDAPEVEALGRFLRGGVTVFTTGVILQEILQGFEGPRQRDTILKTFAALPCIAPEIEDHIDAAVLRTTCRRRGVQIATIDALIATLCIRRDLALLTTDGDFAAVARVAPLRLAPAR